MSMFSCADLKDVLDNFYALPVDQHYDAPFGLSPQNNKNYSKKNELGSSKISSEANTSCNSDEEADSTKLSNLSVISMFNSNCFEFAQEKICITSFLQPKWEQNVKLQKKNILDRFLRAQGPKNVKGGTGKIQGQPRRMMKVNAPQTRQSFSDIYFADYN